MLNLNTLLDLEFKQILRCIDEKKAVFSFFVQSAFFVFDLISLPKQDLFLKKFIYQNDQQKILYKP